MDPTDQPAPIAEPEIISDPPIEQFNKKLFFGGVFGLLAIFFVSLWITWAWMNQAKQPKVTPAPAPNEAVQAPSASSSAILASKLTVAIYNGTSTKGLAKTVGEKLKSQISELEITKVDNAGKNYSKTQLINLANTQNPVLAQLTKILGVEPLNQLTEGEVKPEADVLVILGTDYK